MEFTGVYTIQIKSRRRSLYVLVITNDRLDFMVYRINCGYRGIDLGSFDNSESRPKHQIVLL